MIDNEGIIILAKSKSLATENIIEAANGAIDVEKIFDMGLKVLPNAFALMDRDNRTLSVLFSLLRTLPTILGINKKVIELTERLAPPPDP